MIRFNGLVRHGPIWTLLLGCFLAAGCSGYPRDTVAEYHKSCQRNGFPVSTCKCMMGKIKRRMSYEEYARGAAIVDPISIPADYSDLFFPTRALFGNGGQTAVESFSVFGDSSTGRDLHVVELEKMGVSRTDAIRTLREMAFASGSTRPEMDKETMQVIRLSIATGLSARSAAGDFVLKLEKIYGGCSQDPKYR